MTLRAVVKGVGHYLPERIVPNAEFEKMFYNKEFGVFETLEESIIWASRLISKAELQLT